MALMLVSRGGFSKVNKGIPVLVQSLKWDSARNGPTICAAFLRTGGLGTGTPHETPPMRQTSASMDLPRMDINASVATADGAIVGPHGLRPLEDSAPESQNSNFQAASGEEDRRRNNELLEKAVNTSLACMTTIYDALTLPLYFFVQQPWKQMALHNAPKGILLDEEKMIYGSATPRSKLHQELLDMNIDTMEKVLSYAVSKHANRKCLGARDVIEELEVMDPITGKMVKKFELGDYQWMSFADVNEEAKNVSAGLAKLGLKPKQKIAIFAETRREWLLTAMAAFKQNLTIVTVFTTLGDDGVIHALKETDVTFLITSEELMPRLVNVLPQVPSIQNLIYMNPRNLPVTESVLADIPKNVQTISYSDLVKTGETAPFEEVKPTKHDRAIIMYTSGSTGNPKGVILSHNNIVSGMRSVLDILALSGQPELETDAYIAYLPLAHVLELMSETICFIQGIPIGYSSPLTMTDASLGVKEGTKGDASVLKPTILAGVPLVLERISKGIQTKMAERGKIVELIFNYFYNYKVGWYHKGYDTPLVNKILFNKVKSLIGGRVRFMAVGSAPLAPETHEFIRAVLSCPIVLGYAMTETSSCGTLGNGSDLTVGRVGGPVQCTKIRLVDWEEGGYRVTDQPYPRGEIVMGGDNIAMGYYKNQESTDFYEEDGTRWIKTGDIGEVHPDGVFKIIDRKKDLVKLSNGEYISLGKIESIIKTCKYVENTCVCADSSHSYPVALICISQLHVKKLAGKMGIVDRSFDELCRNPMIEEAILNKVQSHVVLHNLNKFEVPKKIHLVPEPWMPTSGLVTAAFKIKRNNVYKQYEAQINEMYNSYR